MPCWICAGVLGIALMIAQGMFSQFSIVVVSMPAATEMMSG